MQARRPHVLSGSVLVGLSLVVLVGFAALVSQQVLHFAPLRSVRLAPFGDAENLLVVTPELTPAAYLPAIARNYPAAGLPLPTVTLAQTMPPSATPSASPTRESAPTDTYTPTATPSPTPTATPTVPATPAPVIFGVTGPADLVAKQLAFQAGARWFRTSIGWRSIEPSNVDLTDPANGNWPDSSLRQLVDEGFTPILLISNNPSWAVESVPSNHTCGPLDSEDLPELEEFMRALAERYDGDGYKDAPGTPIVIEHFEMYNEPDKLFTHAWTGCWAGDGSAEYGGRYAEMLSYAWRGVHDGNPRGKVLFGGMGAEEGTGGDFGMSGGDWLDDVLGYIQANPGNYFDWMNIHTYFAFAFRWVPWGPDIIGKVAYFRQRLAQFGLDKPMVVTETTLPSDNYGSEILQSRYVVQVFARSLAVGLKAMTWHRLKDVAGESKYGLLDLSGTPKMSYWVYKTTTDELRGVRYERMLEAADVGASDVEGYVFRVPGEEAKWVMWVQGAEESRQVGLPFGRVRVVPMQKYDETYSDVEIPGVTEVIEDGGLGDKDGQVNGEVMLTVSTNPIFVENYP